MLINCNIPSYIPIDLQMFCLACSSSGHPFSFSVFVCRAVAFFTVDISCPPFVLMHLYCFSMSVLLSERLSNVCHGLRAICTSLTSCNLLVFDYVEWFVFLSDFFMLLYKTCSMFVNFSAFLPPFSHFVWGVFRKSVHVLLMSLYASLSLCGTLLHSSMTYPYVY